MNRMVFGSFADRIRPRSRFNLFGGESKDPLVCIRVPERIQWKNTLLQHPIQVGRDSVEPPAYEIGRNPSILPREVKGLFSALLSHG
jgi:hypothetical protein